MRFVKNNNSRMSSRNKNLKKWKNYFLNWGDHFFSFTFYKFFLFAAPDECASSADEGQNSQRMESELPANNLGNTDITPTTISSKEAAQLMQQTYLPNIPLTRPTHNLEMNVFCDKSASETVVEKVGVVKYINADVTCESGNPQNRNCSTLSEKSSDSGVSSSSLSSANHNATRNKQRRSGSKATLIESPTRSYVGHYVSDKKD